MEIGNMLQFAEHLERMHQTTPQQQGAEGRAVSPQEQNSEEAATGQQTESAEGLLRVGSESLRESLRESLPDYLPSSIA